ncbi:hypothetical protein JCM24511_02977 [Saitozyma sp. JCM 24511]|nr:hypothetical protein JCM24511_02977 [Saitozyma sp. JCM 24511]
MDVSNLYFWAAALSLRHDVLSSNPLAEDPDPVDGDANVDGAVDVPDQQQNTPAILRRLDRLERKLRTQIGNVHADLRERLEELEADLGERLQELQAAQRQRAMRERNAMRWELGRDLEPIPVEDRRFPGGLDNVGSQRVRHGRDLRRMSLHDIHLWLAFYGIEAGARVRKRGKAKLLLRFLGGPEKRSL